MNSWSFWNSSSIALKADDASPHTSYLFKFLKNNLGRRWPWGTSKYNPILKSVNHGRFSKTVFCLGRARSIAGAQALSTPGRKTFYAGLSINRLESYPRIGALSHRYQVGISRTQFSSMACDLFLVHPYCAFRDFPRRFRAARSEPKFL